MSDKYPLLSEITDPEDDKWYVFVFEQGHKPVFSPGREIKAMRELGKVIKQDIMNQLLWG